MVRGDGEYPPLLHLILEEVVCERRESPLGPDLHEGPASVGIRPLDLPHPFDGMGHLLLEQVKHPLPYLLGLPLHGIVIRRHVGEHRYPRGIYLQLGKVIPQRNLGRGDNLTVESVGYGDPHRIYPPLPELLQGLVHGTALPRYHRLNMTVLVGRDDVAIDCRENLLDLLQTRHDGGHLPGVVHLEVPHLLPPGGNGLQGILEPHYSRGYERTILSQRMAHHDIRGDAKTFQQPVHARIGRKHRGLIVFGLPQHFRGALVFIRPHLQILEHY